jgi:hypothetical protein
MRGVRRAGPPCPVALRVLARAQIGINDIADEIGRVRALCGMGRSRVFFRGIVAGGASGGQRSIQRLHGD